MSKKKGLSYEEKRKRLLDLLHERKDAFTLKELENLAKKEKGIVPQSVKDVAQGLVDDGDIMLDKVGTTNYYWSFPSQTLITKTNIINKLQEEVDVLKRKRDDLHSEESASTKGREESDERDAKLAKLEEVKAKNAELKAELKKYIEFDPELIEDMESDIAEARDAANRWTDNILTLRKWCSEKFGIEEENFNSNFSVPEDLDYVE